jgi:hypothetical protein
MDKFRPAGLILIFFAQFVIFSGTVIHRRNFPKHNRGKEPDRTLKPANVGLCVSSLIVFSITVAACVLSTKAEQQSLFVALVQSASVTLVAAEVNVILKSLLMLYS